jgi:ribosomal protein S18 acetylase RimI-like enzyme
MAPKPSIHVATPADLPFVLSLAKRETETIGFLPGAAVREYQQAGGILVAEENGEPCGFLVWRLSHGRRRTHAALPTGRHVKIIQAAIHYDVRRLHHGFALVARLERIARRRCAEFVGLFCADDLPANSFWRACNFEWRGTRPGGDRRGRSHNLWIRPSRRSPTRSRHRRPSSREEAPDPSPVRAAAPDDAGGIRGLRDRRAVHRPVHDPRPPGRPDPRRPAPPGRARRDRDPAADDRLRPGVGLAGRFVYSRAVHRNLDR